MSYISSFKEGKNRQRPYIFSNSLNVSFVERNFARKREFPELKGLGKGKGTSIEYLFIMLDDETSIVNISIERCTQFSFSDEAPRLIAMNRYSISPRDFSRLGDQRESRLFKHRMNINSRGRGGGMRSAGARTKTNRPSFRMCRVLRRPSHFFQFSRSRAPCIPTRRFHKEIDAPPPSKNMPLEEESGRARKEYGKIGRGRRENVRRYSSLEHLFPIYIYI